MLVTVTSMGQPTAASLALPSLSPASLSAEGMFVPVNCHCRPTTCPAVPDELTDDQPLKSLSFAVTVMESVDGTATCF